MRELEERFPDELVVVGVHSGKFIAERVTTNIREAALRLGVQHPVVNDRQYRIWRSYAVSAWPTLVLVDPRGYVAGQHAGEATADQLAPAIARVAQAAEQAGTLERAELRFPVEAMPRTPLLYPQKLAVDPPGERLAIADTGHDRIVLVRLLDSGGAAVETIIGSGRPGLEDGPFDSARFGRPHGLAFASDGSPRLFVADTGNHAIRVVDLLAGTVDTLVGSGEQARGWPPAGGVGRDVALSSPWDVLHHGALLYLAMAGRHQLWTVDLATRRAQPWVGSGAEALHDGDARSAALAQPSALATDGTRLYFADSESSAIRWSLLSSGETGTIVGTGLFDFGDRDGAGDHVRLQHPLGLARQAESLLVADTYNDAIKRLHPQTRAVQRLADADMLPLHEPGGIAIHGDRLFVADTNAHRIVAGRIGRGLEELALEGLEPPGHG